MTLEIPVLSLADVREEVRVVQQRRHRSLTTAILAQGTGGTFEVPTHAGPVSYRCVPVRCELELRRALAFGAPRLASPDTPGAPADPQALGEHLALLVSYSVDQLPADLAGRLAGGKVWPVDRERRIARFFRVSAVHPDLRADRGLCEAILAEGAEFSGQLDGNTVDLPTAWRYLLQRHAGLPMTGDLPEERWLEHCLTQPVPPWFGSTLGVGAPLGRVLAAFLERAVGPVAPIALVAWERGTIRNVAAIALLLEAALPHLDEDRALRATLSLRLEALEPRLRDAPRDNMSLCRRWGALWAPLRRRLSDERAREIAALADSLVSDDVLEPLASSRDLPRAFRVQEERLARALTAAARSLEQGEPGLHAPEARAQAGEALQQARAALEVMATHQLAATHDGAEAYKRGWMAARLLAYLHGRPDLADQAALGGSFGEMLALAEHYAAEGGFVDLARARARGPSTGALGAAIEAVLKVVDRVRDEDDTRFSRSLSGWIRSGSPSTRRVVPIAQTLDRFALEFLAEQPHRKLLVALLDGMSWANAVELLLDAEEKRYGLLRAPVGKSARGGRPVPVLAALPTLTGVSRSAFFAGKAVKVGEPLDTTRDPQRLREHAGLRRAGITDATLYLRDRVETQGGDVHPDAIALVRSRAPLVAVVVNALDDQLGGSRQMRVEADLEHIKPLGQLLTAATEAGRAVLLVSDHGHALASRMRSVGREEGSGGRRWRPLGEGEAAAVNEIAFGREDAWVPRGKAAVAMLFQETDSYGTTMNPGEHGGASLAEVVAPALLIGAEDLRRRVAVSEAVEDRELDVMPLPRPDFWDLTLPTVGPARAAPARQPTPARPKTPVPQLGLPFPGAASSAEPPPPARTPASSASDASPWLARLTQSKAFKHRSSEAEKRRLKERIAPAVALLAEQDGSLPEETFARKIGVMPHAVAGAVAEMAEWINFDQYPVIEHDRAAKRVRLQVDLLDQFLKEEG